MSTSVASVVSHFPDAENGFTTTTAGSVSSGAATVTLNSVAGYTNGEPVVLVIDPTDASKKQTFTGIVDTSGVQITSVVWTAGTNQTHALGATVVDYATATHIAMISRGIKVNHTQKGNHKTLTDDNANEWIGLTTTASAVNYANIANAATGNPPIISAKGDDTNVGLTLTPKGTGAITMTSRADGWVTGLTAPGTITYNGNRSYQVVISATDYTDRLSNGMRLRFTRTVSAPTKCTDLESGSSQYYNKTSPNKSTFADDFVCMAWVKLESYVAGANQVIISRYNGTSGWALYIEDTTGRVILSGYKAGAANYSNVISPNSIPLGKWVHVAAQLDMSAYTSTTSTSYIMFDGVDVTSGGTTNVSRGGTNPTDLTQAGDLVVGNRSGGTAYFDGKIAQAAFFTAKVTQATVLTYIAQPLAGTETNLGSAYSFNNSIADLNTTTPNDLTAQGSAVATNADSPFAQDDAGVPGGTTDYGIITARSFSTDTTLTVQVPEGNTIPTSGGVSAMAYSTQKNPFGFPTGSDRWTVKTIHQTDAGKSSPAQNTWYGDTGLTSAGPNLTIPIGSWRVRYQATVWIAKSSGTTVDMQASLSTAANSQSDTEFSVYGYMIVATGNTGKIDTFHKVKELSLAAATPYYLVIRTTQASMTNLDIRGDLGMTQIEAVCAHL